MTTHTPDMIAALSKALGSTEKPLKVTHSKKTKPETYTAQGAWNAGYRAFRAGDESFLNPYLDSTSDHDHWNAGWAFAARTALASRY